MQLCLAINDREKHQPWFRLPSHGSTPRVRGATGIIDHSMLVELLVENYAVVDRIRVRFHPGLNLLTGETGSGKSIVGDAFGLLLGGRASAEMIRSGEARARVAGIFDVRDRADVRALLEPAGFAIEDSELLIEREILAGGKSRAFLGSRPVAVSLLRELAPLLGDIHGQHDQQLLFSSDAQRDMLDTFASSGGVLARVAEIYAGWKTAGTALETLERTEQEKLRLLDLWEFQRKEIEGAAPAAGEDETLEAERRVLQNLGRLQENAGTAYAALYDSPEAALAQVRLAAKRLDDVCRIDPSLAGLGEYLQSADVAIKEACAEHNSAIVSAGDDNTVVRGGEREAFRLAARDYLQINSGRAGGRFGRDFQAQLSAFLDLLHQHLRGFLPRSGRTACQDYNSLLEIAGKRGGGKEGGQDCNTGQFQFTHDRIINHKQVFQNYTVNGETGNCLALISHKEHLRDINRAVESSLSLIEKPAQRTSAEATKPGQHLRHRRTFERLYFAQRVVDGAAREQRAVPVLFEVQNGLRQRGLMLRTD